jgi:hypothetical protein
MKTMKIQWLWLVVIGIFLSGCSRAPVERTQAEATPTEISPTATPLPTSTPVPSTDTPTPTYTPLPPTLTDTPSPTLTAAPTETTTPTLTSTSTPAATQAGAQAPSVSENAVRIFFIRLNTGGTVGCGDSAIAVGAGVESSGDIEKDVTAGLERLFTYKTEYVGDLYNPLYRSNIKLQEVNFNSKNGLITVDLTGTYKPSGDRCDNTRVKAQVWMTIRQYRGVTATNIYLNGIPFGDRVSND